MKKTTGRERRCVATMNIAALVVISLSILSCTIYGPPFEDYMASNIGKKFREVAQRPLDMYKKTDTSVDIEEYEYTTGRGCSYAYIVRKLDGVVVGWRYTIKDIKPCKQRDRPSA